jgi:hypothetical protein
MKERKMNEIKDHRTKLQGVRGTELQGIRGIE